MGRKAAPAKVININKYGEVFNPSEYRVCRADNPELYEFLSKVGMAKAAPAPIPEHTAEVMHHYIDVRGVEMTMPWKEYERLNRMTGAKQENYAQLLGYPIEELRKHDRINIKRGDDPTVYELVEKFIKHLEDAREHGRANDSNV